VGEQLNLTATTLHAAAADGMDLHAGGRVALSADVMSAVLHSGIDVSSTDMYVMLNRSLDVSAVKEISLATTTLFVDASKELVQTAGEAVEIAAGARVALSSGGTLDAFAADGASLSAGAIEVISGGLFNLSATALEAGIETNLSLAVRDTAQLAAGQLNLMVDRGLDAVVAGETLLTTAGLAVTSGSVLDAVARDSISAQAERIAVTAVEGLAINARKLGADFVENVDIAAGGTTELTTVDARLNAYGEVDAAVVRGASLTADSLRVDALEAVDIAAARVDITAGRR
jgi:hypothetical protein